MSDASVSPPKANGLSGHTLRGGGRVWGFHHQYGSKARCSCGAMSPMLSTTPARLKWHREHKDEVRAARQAGQ